MDEIEITFIKDISDLPITQSLPDLDLKFLDETLPNWRGLVTNELREHMVMKLQLAIFPQSMESIYHNDDRVGKLREFCRKVEDSYYNKANSREEYYQMLAERIYKCQKEIEEMSQRTFPAQQPMEAIAARHLEPLENPSNWRRHVNNELREYLAKHIVLKVLPANGKKYPNDEAHERINKLLEFARKLEVDCYTRANSREMYYQLIAEKIYAIQKQLGKKEPTCNIDATAIVAELQSRR